MNDSAAEQESKIAAVRSYDMSVDPPECKYCGSIIQPFDETHKVMMGWESKRLNELTTGIGPKLLFHFHRDCYVKEKNHASKQQLESADR